MQYRFAAWRFKADTGDLYEGASVTRLEPKVAALLAYFLTHQHKVITREELVATVWEGRTITDDAITRCVSILRQLLSPDDKNLYIETVVRKGYLAHFPPAEEQASSGRIPRVRQRFLWLVALAVLAALALPVLFERMGSGPALPSPPARSPGPPMVAVLPFTASGEEGDSTFFADGIYEDLLTQLSKLQAVRVISSTSTREYRNVARNIRRIGEELGADVIIEGSVQIAGARIRINAQVIDAHTDEHLWAQGYDRDLTLANVFDIQSEIASAIASEMKASLTRQDRQQLALIPTENMAAYRAYHRAMRMRENDYGVLDEPQYRQALEEAVALDPNFTRALAELVSALTYTDFHGDQPALTLQAEQALDQLQKVAPGSADHLIGQAAYVYYTLRDFDTAHDLLTRALSLNPSDVNAMRLKSWVERRQGNFEAYLATRYATRRLNPRDPESTDELLSALMLMHRYEQAWAESAATTLNTFYIAYVRLLHRFSRDRDLSTLRLSVEQLCQQFPQPDCGWDMYVANRDYAAALATLSETEEDQDAPNSNQSRRWMFTVWLTGDYSPLADRLPAWKNRLTDHVESVDVFHRSPFYLGLGLLEAITGNPEAATSWIDHWERQVPVDWAERMMRRHDVCRVLGILADVSKVAQCIRDGLAEASMVMPFFEPAMPFYDAVRNEPEFMALVAEIENTWPSGSGAAAGEGRIGLTAVGPQE
ncbi:winged helix-turn-helix domain-containing protein [Parahaliea maris]|uniref:winged helix-turn-helix domain-containing protein n=1 Tax=Parahaliea maris TaxID=2716870 RepID=UPI0016500F65|nr:winged helix-turn-helix domain-containing protein [Parahaliea maris]